MRLANVDEMFKYFWEKGQSNPRGKYKIGENWELNGAEIREVIAELPVIGDDSIVANGRYESYWEPERHGGFSPGGNPLYRCHNCKWVFGTHMIYPNFRYCPECGYKMIPKKEYDKKYENTV